MADAAEPFLGPRACAGAVGGPSPRVCHGRRAAGERGLSRHPGALPGKGGEQRGRARSDAPLLSPQRLKEAAVVLGGGGLIFAAHLVARGDEHFYRRWLMPGLQRVVGPETAHRLAVRLVALGIVPRPGPADSEILVRGRAEPSRGRGGRGAAGPGLSSRPGTPLRRSVLLGGGFGTRWDWPLDLTSTGRRWTGSSRWASALWRWGALRRSPRKATPSRGSSGYPKTKRSSTGGRSGGWGW